MSHINLRILADRLPAAWKSMVIGNIGSANVKVLRMNDAPYAEEEHDYAEGLLVIDGRMNLAIGGRQVAVGAGEIFIVPPRTLHAVAAGSAGTLVVLDVP
jgi:mannose-6-phosphate isomerase-like protein (cupin superfamily)